MGVDRSVNGMRCLCCNRGSIETVQHALLECPEYDSDDIRFDFYKVADEIYPEFSAFSDKEKCTFLFSDKTNGATLGNCSFKFRFFTKKS